MLLLTPSVTFAQLSGPAPGPLPFPPPLPSSSEPSGLGGGTIVGKSAASVSVLPVARNADPIPMMPSNPGTGPVPTPVTAYPPVATPGVAVMPPAATTIPGMMSMPMPTSNTSLLTDSWQLMLGRNGPVGEDLYFRTGASVPFGVGALAKNLDVGCNATIGGRSLFFNPEGSTAWVIDAHLSYTYNNASGQEVVFFRNEANTVRALTRWGVGLGVGHDWFSSGPGFLMGQWDMNFNWGIDLGGRWGTGHADFNPVNEIEGYRRHHDVYGQSFLGLHLGAEVPMGGWTMLLGGRAEWNTTYSDHVPANSTLHSIDVLFSFGVRY